MAINTNHSLNKIVATDSDLVLDSASTGSNISVNSNRVTNVQDPIDDQDAVTKKFLDERLNSLSGGVSTDLDLINSILGKLTPPSPDTLSNENLTILGTSSARITDFVQTDNSNNGLSANPGSIVQYVKRDNDYQLSTITKVSPGDSGTIEVIRNGTTTVSFTFDETVNDGTYTDTDTIIIDNNVDYGTISGDPLGFNFIYDAIVLGTNTVSEGWNTVKVSHNGEETNTVTWYSDQSNPGAPTATNISVTPSTTNIGVTYSSGIQHYTSQQQFDVSFDVANLSGDFYPATDTFITPHGYPLNAGITNPSSKTYDDFSIQTPLTRNYLTDGSTLNIGFSVNVNSGTGISLENKGPTIKIDNSYQTSNVFLPVNEKILYMEDDGFNTLDETNILVENVGFGSGNARRVTTLSAIDTPLNDTNINFDSENTSIMPYDATIVGGVLTHDTTDYSTGYLPIGPNLSIGRDGAQYIQFAFNRTAVSKFAMNWSGKISGCWVKLPGSSIDSTSGSNGWLDATVPYEGIGVPGSNTNFGGNGSDGCGLAGTISTGIVVNNETINITFGTESSSNSTDNIIMIRLRLEDGDYVDHLKFVEAV